MYLQGNLLENLFFVHPPCCSLVGDLTCNLCRGKATINNYAVTVLLLHGEGGEVNAFLGVNVKAHSLWKSH